MPRFPLVSLWTEEEIAELKLLLAQGRSAGRIAARLKRSAASVQRMCVKLGLPTPAQIKKQKDAPRH